MFTIRRKTGNEKPGNRLDLAAPVPSHTQKTRRPTPITTQSLERKLGDFMRAAAPRPVRVHHICAETGLGPPVWHLDAGRVDCDGRGLAWVIAWFHLTGAEKDLFKVNAGSWTYPEPALLKIATVSLIYRDALSDRTLTDCRTKPEIRQWPPP